MVWKIKRKTTLLPQSLLHTIRSTGGWEKRKSLGTKSTEEDREKQTNRQTDRQTKLPGKKTDRYLDIVNDR